MSRSCVRRRHPVDRLRLPTRSDGEQEAERGCDDTDGAGEAVRGCADTDVVPRNREYDPGAEVDDAPVSGHLY